MAGALRVGRRHAKSHHAGKLRLRRVDQACQISAVQRVRTVRVQSTMVELPAQQACDRQAEVGVRQIGIDLARADVQRDPSRPLIARSRRN